MFNYGVGKFWTSDKNKAFLFKAAHFFCVNGGSVKNPHDLNISLIAEYVVVIMSSESTILEEIEEQAYTHTHTHKITLSKMDSSRCFNQETHYV